MDVMQADVRKPFRDRLRQLPEMQVERRTLQKRVERFLQDGDSASQNYEPNQDRCDRIDIRPYACSSQKRRAATTMQEARASCTRCKKALRTLMSSRL